MAQDQHHDHGHDHDHSHGHHHGHHHGHGHHHHGGPDSAVDDNRRARMTRFGIAGFVVLIALISACLTVNTPGEAVVVTRFGNPVRISVEPGLVWKLPVPIENVTRVNLRLRSTSSGLQDVGTRDGLRVLVQAYVAWQVPNDPEHIRQFLRAVRNEPDLAAQQLRSFIGSALEVMASSYELANLVNTDGSKIRLEEFESQLQSRIDTQARRVYGIAVKQVGLERLTLPTETLNATVSRMRAERQTVATERQAEGARVAAEIASNADRDARVITANAKAAAAAIEGKSRVEAADIYAKAYNENRNLYSLLRSLDTLDGIIGSNTRIVLKTDAAPFRVLVDGPDAADRSVPGAAK